MPDFVFEKIMMHDFHNSLSFQLYDSNKLKAHSAGMELLMSDFDGINYYGTHNPNIMYFEFPSDIHFWDIKGFLQNSFLILEGRCAIGNIVISENQYYYPSSYKKAIQQLSKYPICFPKGGYFFNFVNEIQNDILCGANLIQIYSSEYRVLFDTINIVMLDKIANYKFSEFYMFDILNGFELNSYSELSEKDNLLIFERLKKLHKLVKTKSISLEKRRDRYFKPNEWNEWIRRFD